MIEKIDTKLKLPYKLIDIRENDELFVLAFKCFDDNQTDYSIQAGGVTGKFDITYKCRGIECKFECDVTIGNLYYFYIELENVYECLPEVELVAVLKNYAPLDRTRMTFEFDKRGHCIVNGCFKNKQNNYKSGIIFDIQLDTVSIYDIINSLKNFFEELKRIQGHSNFY